MTSAAQMTTSTPSEAEQKNWQPLLDGDRRQAALDAVWQIAESLPDALTLQNIASEHKPTVFHPSAALCWKAEAGLFYAYLAKAFGHEESGQKAWGYLEEAINEAADQFNTAWMFGGLTELGWIIANLEGIILSAEDTESCDAVDEIIHGQLNQPGWQSDYDLITGLVGYGVYALERMQRRPNRAAVEIASKVVAKLWESAEHSKQEVTWHTSPSLLPEWQVRLCPDGYYNLGLAHGVPGVIALLGRNIAAGIEPERSQTLLEGAVRWMLAQTMPTDVESSFASWAGPGIVPETSKLAWCYGDLGAGAALLYAARNAGNAHWESEAIGILRKAARRSFESAGVFDACLCHGAAGNAHIFNRVYQATAKPEFKAAALAWYERALGCKRPTGGIGGFSIGEIDERSREMRWVNKPGLLDGAAGIGLALLASSSRLSPDWDRSMLISIPSNSK